MLPLVPLVLPCPGPQTEEFGKDRGRGPSTLNSKCPHTQTGRVLGGQSKFRIREKTGGLEVCQLGLFEVSRGLREKLQMCR